MVEILGTHVWKWKMRPAETVPGMGGEWWRGWIQLWYTVRTFVNVTVYPLYNNNIIKNENNFKK
jgi:hypothetical protein